MLGGVSALLGIAHAAVQNRLSRVIAYSSVENSGLIITGFGVALTGASVGNQQLVAIGLLAATLQMVTHTVAKSLLFTAAAGIEATPEQDAPGESATEVDPIRDYPPRAERRPPCRTAGAPDDLELLRGAGRRAPWSGAGLAVGAVTLAGLPPTAGFVSEWFLLESLMQQFRVASLGGRLTLALAGAAVALTAGFAGVTFVRLVGMVVLGAGRRHAGFSGAGGEYGWPGRIGLAVLAACPLAIRGGDTAGDPGDRGRACRRPFRPG